MLVSANLYISIVISDSFKDLVTKKNLFILGKDIWTKEECRGVIMKKKMLETNAVEAKKAKMVSKSLQICK